MGVSKVNFGITTLIDLTEDSVDVVSVHVGSGMPSPDLGSEGDLYLDMG